MKKTRGFLHQTGQFPLLGGSLLVLVLFCTILPSAQASFSIVATDSKTRQVGGAGATCLAGLDIYTAFYVSAPNRSVLHTQGLLMSRDPEHPVVTLAREQMREGRFTPEQVLTNMINLDTGRAEYQGLEFAEVQSRQYAIADFDSSFSYTGSDLFEFWDYLGYPNTEIANLGWSRNGYRFHAIANVVANGTVAAMGKGFREPGGDDLGEDDDLAGRLMSALNRVSESGLGDVRCPQGATGAYLHVDNPDGTPFVHINVVDGVSPVREVAEAYLEWRKENPVPTSAPTSVEESSGSGFNLFLSGWIAVAAAVAATIV